MVHLSVLGLQSDLMILKVISYLKLFHESKHSINSQLNPTVLSVGAVSPSALNFWVTEFKKDVKVLECVQREKQSW